MSKTKEEILQVYPNAIWFPFPDCLPPIGTKVREQGKELVLVVTGYQLDETVPTCHCPTCSCREPAPFINWVKCSGMKVLQGKSVVDAVVFKYPPALEPA